MIIRIYLSFILLQRYKYSLKLPNIICYFYTLFYIFPYRQLNGAFTKCYFSFAIKRSQGTFECFLAHSKASGYLFRCAVIRKR